MPNDPDFDALADEAERLQIYFLERELELSQRFIVQAHAGLALGHSSQVRRILIAVQSTIHAVRNFIDQVSSKYEQARLAEELAKIELAADQLKPLVKPQS